jgi:hypothetical protein
MSTLGVACDGQLRPDGEWAGRWQEAQEANAAALRLHTAGDYQGSRSGFEAALAIDERYDLARFNLACARSRLGDLEGAVRELRTLFEIDLPRFGPRYLADPDLEPVRSSPLAASVTAHLERVRAAVETAIRDGLPVVLAIRPSGFMSGAFMVGGRCIPVTEPGNLSSDYIVLDRAHRRFAYVSAGSTSDDIEADEVFQLLGAGVVPFALDGGARASAQFEYPEAVGEPDAYPRWIDTSGDDVLFRLEDDWHRIAGHRLVVVPGARQPPPRRDERVPDGFALVGNRLTVPVAAEPIDLGNGHARARWHSFALRPDGSAIAVASESVEREPEEIGFEQSAVLHSLVVDHVDLTSRRVTRLVSQPVHGFVVEHEGDLYLSHGQPLGDDDGTLRTYGLRYRGFSPEAREELWHLTVLPVTGP